MRILSQKYKELASRAGRYPKLRMELYAGTRGAWTDTVEAEYNGENAIVSATYTNGITTKPSRFETGLAFCGSLEIELHGVPTTPFANGKRFKLFAGFYDPDEDNTVEASVGEFFIESVSADNGKTTVKARDKMMFAEQKFNAVGMTYPCSLLDCVREIFRQEWLQTNILPEGYFFRRDYPCEIINYDLFSNEPRLSQVFFFDNYTDYFVFLFLKFAEQQRRVLECPCCGKLFVPKSNRAEIYCDRILIDGKTCKQIAPKLARKLKQRNDPLLEEYERAKNRNYKRVERYESADNISSVKRLTFNEYKAWLDKASEMKRLYLQGKVSADQLRKVIQKMDLN